MSYQEVRSRYTMACTRCQFGNKDIDYEISVYKCTECSTEDIMFTGDITNSRLKSLKREIITLLLKCTSVKEVRDLMESDAFIKLMWFNL